MSTAGAAGTIVLGEGSPAQTFGIVATGSVLDYFIDPQNNLFVIQTDGTSSMSWAAWKPFWTRRPPRISFPLLSHMMAKRSS